MRFGQGGIEEVMLNIDINNTINGGMVKVVVNKEEYQDEYVIDVKIPSISGDKLRLKLHKNILFVMHRMEYEVRLEDYFIPLTQIIQKIPLPRNANPMEIEAIHNGNKLMIYISKGGKRLEETKDVEIDIK